MEPDERTLTLAGKPLSQNGILPSPPPILPSPPPGPGGVSHPGCDRAFLFLQGPHGPFFHQLGRMLRETGARVCRVGFNAGDRAFWPDRASYIPHRASPREWPDHLETLIGERNISDIVLYGDTRPVHAHAIRIARARGLRVHVFEEGYLRPYWITYERDGANGNSRLMNITIDEMRTALEGLPCDMPEAPAHWGDLRQHVFYGALYHWFVMFLNRGYPGFRPHRRLTVTQEFRLYLRRLLLMPAHRAERAFRTRRLIRSGHPYHLVLLQLDHDTSVRDHSPFAGMNDFLELVVAGFARGAPRHHHLVFKAHPLESGQVPLRRRIRDLAARHDVTGRVHYIGGGKLAALLDHARSAVTINSTAAHQALWRGLPLRAFGKAIYGKNAFTSSQPLHEFFAAPRRPDSAAYVDFRRFLLETSQVPGGYYSARGRRQLLRHVVDLMLAADDPYEALKNGNAAPRQQLFAIS